MSAADAPAPSVASPRRAAIGPRRPRAGHAVRWAPTSAGSERPAAPALNAPLYSWPGLDTAPVAPRRSLSGCRSRGGLHCFSSSHGGLSGGAPLHRDWISSDFTCAWKVCSSLVSVSDSRSAGAVQYGQSSELPTPFEFAILFIRNYCKLH
jgi:hypothetical protein